MFKNNRWKKSCCARLIELDLLDVGKISHILKESWRVCYKNSRAYHCCFSRFPKLCFRGFRDLDHMFFLWLLGEQKPHFCLAFVSNAVHHNSELQTIQYNVNSSCCSSFFSSVVSVSDETGSTSLFLQQSPLSSLFYCARGQISSLPTQIYTLL